MRTPGVSIIFWRSVVGYEGLYRVSNDGRIASKKRSGTPGVVLKLSMDDHGYLTVCLSKQGKQRTFLVSRIVAIAFIPNPLCLPEVNHKDLNKTNNHSDNLEWMTSSQNTKHSYDKGAKKPLWGSDNPNAKLDACEVRIIRKRIARGDNQSQIARDFGVTPGAITQIKYRAWRHL